MKIMKKGGIENNEIKWVKDLIVELRIFLGFRV